MNTEELFKAALAARKERIIILKPTAINMVGTQIGKGQYSADAYIDKGTVKPLPK